MCGLLSRRVFTSLPIPNDGNAVLVDLIRHKQLFQYFSAKTSLLVKVDGQQQEDEKNPSFTVSYLVNSCGLSPENASSISKRFRIESPEGPNSVLSLLREHGFSNTQISKVISKRPQVILADSEKTLLPKLQFFLSMKGSKPIIIDTLSRHACFFAHSLEKKILPYYNFLKNEVCLDDDDKVVKAMYGLFRFHHPDSLKLMPSNIALLKELGVPKSSIAIFLTCHRGLLNKNIEEFSQQVQRIVKMGFSPSTLNFVRAMVALFAQKSSNWEHKMEVYKSWGWSEDEIWSAFRKQPICMILSEKKVVGTMDFLVNTVGMKPPAVANYPVLLFYSLNKRLVPRFNVMKLLQSKGLIEKNIRFDYVLSLNKKCFIDRFVTKYVDDVPQLLKIVGGEMNL